MLSESRNLTYAVCLLFGLVFASFAHTCDRQDTAMSHITALEARVQSTAKYVDEAQHAHADFDYTLEFKMNALYRIVEFQGQGVVQDGSRIRLKECHREDATTLSCKVDLIP